MISIGTAIILLFTSLSIAAKAFRNIQVNSTDVVTGLNKLPALLIGFGVFLLFTRTEFHSGIINGMAKGAFAVLKSALYVSNGSSSTHSPYISGM